LVRFSFAGQAGFGTTRTLFYCTRRTSPQGVYCLLA